MYCEKCGSKVSENDVFCLKCGRRLVSIRQRGFQNSNASIYHNSINQFSIKGYHLRGVIFYISMWILLCVLTFIYLNNSTPLTLIYEGTIFPAFYWTIIILSLVTVSTFYMAIVKRLKYTIPIIAGISTIFSIWCIYISVGFMVFLIDTYKKILLEMEPYAEETLYSLLMNNDGFVSCGYELTLSVLLLALSVITLILSIKSIIKKDKT